MQSLKETQYLQNYYSGLNILKKNCKNKNDDFNFCLFQ